MKYQVFVDRREGDVVDYQTLSPNVLAVARVRADKTWTAYIGATSEPDHRTAIWYVLSHGSPLPEGIALAIFPLGQNLTYRV